MSHSYHRISTGGIINGNCGGTYLLTGRTIQIEVISVDMRKVCVISLDLDNPVTGETRNPQGFFGCDFFNEFNESLTT